MNLVCDALFLFSCFPSICIRNWSNVRAHVIRCVCLHNNMYVWEVWDSLQFCWCLVRRACGPSLCLFFSCTLRTVGPFFVWVRWSPHFSLNTTFCFFRAPSRGSTGCWLSHVRNINLISSWESGQTCFSSIRTELNKKKMENEMKAALMNGSICIDRTFPSGSHVSVKVRRRTSHWAADVTNKCRVSNVLATITLF